MNKPNTQHGIVTKCVGGLYTVRLTCPDEGAKYIECRARGRFRHDGMSPLPGDDVTVIEGDDALSGEYVLDEILPRHSSLIRPPIANLTHLFLLIPSCRPKPDLLTADKITAIAEHVGVEPVIVAGKADMDSESAENIRKTYSNVGYNAFAVSAVTGIGIDELAQYISLSAEDGVRKNMPMRAAFVGVSGAGKSTLMSAIFPKLSLATGKLSNKTMRGRHTTRAVELFYLESPVEGCDACFYLADTPGFSMLDFTGFNFFPADKLAENFREFAPLLGNCRYTKCTHTKEDECAVLDAVQSGKISGQRHESFCRIYEELKAKPEWKRQRELEAQNGVHRRK